MKTTLNRVAIRANTISAAAFLLLALSGRAVAQAGPQIASIALTPTAVAGGATSTGIVGLTRAAPAGGLAVHLQAGSTLVGVPAWVTVTAGQTSGTFSATTAGVSSKSGVPITASTLASRATAVLTVLPAGANAQVPQSASASFRSTGTAAPQNGQTWDITRTGAVRANSGSAAGWSVNLNTGTSVFTVWAPPEAAVAPGYMVRYKSGTQTYSATFDVVPAGAGILGAPAPPWASASVPIDGAGSPPTGPSSANSVELASGVAISAPDPDVIVRNPVGPRVAFTRLYRSSLAAQGYGSPGLSPGWVDNFDVTVQTDGPPGVWAPLRIVYPSGAVDGIAPILNSSGAPTGRFATPPGAPYLVTGTPSATVGQWTDLQVLDMGETISTFTPVPSNPAAYRLTRTTNPLGQSLYISFDAQGRLLGVSTSFFGGVQLLRAQYNGAGQLASITDSSNRRVDYTFGPAAGTSCLVAVSQPEFAGSPEVLAWRYGYEQHFGQPFLDAVAKPSPINSGTVSLAGIVYDGIGRAKALTDADGQSRIYMFATAATQVKVQNASGSPALIWTQKLDAAGRDTGTVDAAGNATSVQYGDSVNPYSPTRIVNENGQAVELAYDPYGHVVRSVDMRGVSTLYQYSYAVFPLGRLASVQQGSRTPTLFQYYSNGLLSSVSRPRPGSSSQTTGEEWVTTRYAYTALGNVAAISAPPPNSSGVNVTYRFGYTFDPFGNYWKSEAIGEPVYALDPTGAASHFRYDGAGNVTATIDGAGIRTDYQFNAANQLTGIVYPATGQTGAGRSSIALSYLYPGGPLLGAKLYDESGALVIGASTSLGRESELLASRLGNLPLGSNAYDGAFRTTAASDGNGQTTRFAFDPAGDLTRITLPLGNGLRLTRYDGAGNLLQAENGRGTLAAFLRAPDDSRVTDVRYSDTTPAVHLDYDAYGRVAHRSDGSGDQWTTYDDNDLVTSVTTKFKTSTTPPPANLTRTISYSFYPDGSRAGMSTPAGGFGYSYDLAGRMTEATFPWTNGYVQYRYLPNGWLWQQTTAQTVSTWAYNALGLPISLVNTQFSTSNTPPPVFSSFANLRYNALGELTAMSSSVPTQSGYADGSGTQAWSYDLAGRLSSESASRPSLSGGSWSFGYGFDNVGNLTDIRGSSASYNQDNEPTTSTSDLDGNDTTFGTYDAGSNLVSSSVYGAASYNADGDRISRTTGGSTTYFLNDGDTVLSELDASGNVLWTYGYGANGLAQASSGASSYIGYAFDPFGNAVQAQASTSSAPNAFAAYDALGYRQGLWGTSPRTADPVGYQGQWGAYTDQSSTPSNALVMGARPYYPMTGRYITPAGTSYTGPVAAIPADGDFYDELGNSASAGALYGKAFRKGAGDLLAMPAFRPGSSDRVKLAGMLDAIPFLGNLKLVLQALTGTDYAAGTPLSPGERVLDGILGLLPFASEFAPEAKGALGGARAVPVEDVAAPIDGASVAETKQLRRPYLRKATKEAIFAAARNNGLVTPDGKFIDPNTLEVIEGKFHVGHVYGRENFRLLQEAREAGMSQSQFNNWVNSHPEWFQIQDPVPNMSHRFEMPK